MSNSCLIHTTPVETWKEFEANEVSHSVGHHLVAIHELGEPYGGWARVSDIARRLDITRGTVSINLRSIKARGLVLEDDRHQVKLSPEGLKIAHSLIGKKAAVKSFLQHVLGVPEDVAERDSCKVEHLLSGDTGSQLVQFMQYLLSADAGARQALERFRKFKNFSTEPQTCPICKGRCLIEEVRHSAA